MRKLFKKYVSREDFVDDYEATLKNGGLMLEVHENIPPRDPVEIDLQVETKNLGTLPGEAVFVPDGEPPYQVGIELRGEWKDLLEEWVEKLSDSDTKRKKWGTDSESLQHVVKDMETHEKVQLAIKGNKAERQILMKDQHYMVHQYVLKNPRITPDEIAQFARKPSLSGEMVQTIVGNREWMQNMTVKLAMIKNPKTPANIVQKHIGSLRDNDLMKLAKSENVRDAVSKAAIRVLASRGKVVRK